LQERSLTNDPQNPQDTPTRLERPRRPGRDHPGPASRRRQPGRRPNLCRQLEAAGVVQASAYWRKDRAGNPTILYLNHSSQNGQRRREYVGKDPAKQADALLRIERWEQRQHLLQQANHLTTHLDRLQRNIRAIQLTAADLHRQTTELIPQEEIK
jgi:uncharacterized sporulation protein YeaH/YhbH (DUF444 family)